MANLGIVSLQRLSTCRPQMQAVVRAAERNMPSHLDFTVVCGHRGEMAQEKAFNEGKSRARFGESKHNSDPSGAVDLAPYRDGRISWDDVAAFHYLSTYMFAAALALDVKIRWGGHFKANGDKPHGWDPGHFELIE